jgi:asparagine synthase (glutamine-hydrolysing)
MRGLVPDVILNRKDKIGFHTPGADLLLQAKQWVENSISRIPEEAAAIIDEAGLRKAWEAVQAGKLNNQQYQGFWRVLAFLRWLQLRD